MYIYIYIHRNRYISVQAIFNTNKTQIEIIQSQTKIKTSLPNDIHVTRQTKK